MTAGLGVPSTLTWNGSSSTAPEIPAGAATTAMTYAAASAATSVQPAPSTPSRYRVPDQAMNQCPANCPGQPADAIPFPEGPRIVALTWAQPL